LLKSGSTISMRIDMKLRTAAVSVNNQRFVEAGVQLPARVRPYILMNKKGDTVSLNVTRCA